MAEVRSCIQEALPQNPYLTEEFPQPTQVAAHRWQLRRARLSQFNILSLTCSEIQEVEEEAVSTMDQERAQRTFLQSLETLRRSTETLHLGRGRLSSCSTSSLDSGDSDCAP